MEIPQGPKPLLLTLFRLTIFLPTDLICFGGCAGADAVLRLRTQPPRSRNPLPPACSHPKWPQTPQITCGCPSTSLALGGHQAPRAAQAVTACGNLTSVQAVTKGILLPASPLHPPIALGRMRWWWRAQGAAEAIGSPPGSLGASPLTRLSREITAWSSREPSSRGSHSLESPIRRKSHQNLPPAKGRWLRCLPIAEPACSAAYLRLGNPQELPAGEAVCQEPPALAGILPRDFWFSCCFVFKTSAACFQWEFAGIRTGEKLLESARGTKGLLCRRVWRTRRLSVLLPSLLFSPCWGAPAGGAGGTGCSARRGHTDTRTDASRCGQQQGRALRAAKRSPKTHRGVQSHTGAGWPHPRLQTLGCTPAFPLIY